MPGLVPGIHVFQSPTNAHRDKQILMFTIGITFTHVPPYARLQHIVLFFLSELAEG
jgi:hypothetical protein